MKTIRAWLNLPFTLAELLATLKRIEATSNKVGECVTENRHCECRPQIRVNTLMHG